VVGGACHPFAVKRLGGNCVQVDGPETTNPAHPKVPHTQSPLLLHRVLESTEQSSENCAFEVLDRPSNLITNES
jgi:hypothetical protein